MRVLTQRVCCCFADALCLCVQENDTLQKQNELLRSSEAAYQREAQLVGGLVLVCGFLCWCCVGFGAAVSVLMGTQTDTVGCTARA